MDQRLLITVPNSCYKTCAHIIVQGTRLGQIGCATWCSKWLANNTIGRLMSIINFKLPQHA
eukprot:9032077-Ditylum_brightwellii.AAC.1